MAEPPLCSCHGEPMIWSSRPKRPSGGHWRCAVKQREYDRRYDASANGRARHRRYRNSPGGTLNRQLMELNRIRVRY